MCFIFVLSDSAGLHRCSQGVANTSKCNEKIFAGTVSGVCKGQDLACA